VAGIRCRDTWEKQLPPARLIYDDTHRGFVANSMVSAGAVIRGAVITKRVIGANVHVDRDSQLHESVALPGARIGANCTLRRTIIGGNTVIPTARWSVPWKLVGRDHPSRGIP
jgi:glucose-1-phosphate adenylyltransferase